jgi:hypothetical protein
MKHIEKIREWINASQNISVTYKNETEKILEMILQKYKKTQPTPVIKLGKTIHSFKKLKQKTYGKIIMGLSKA